MGRPPCAYKKTARASRALGKLCVSRSEKVLSVLQKHGRDG